ncbi:hypothetical protein [Bandra megavirus]|uniref:Uncharacterized protein n=1 Tax=Bandra megavirus TaxID=2071566 RepID=A0A2K9V7S1_9VIRU|nr:hypothetical protein [Bandra megavirus]
MFHKVRYNLGFPGTYQLNDSTIIYEKVYCMNKNDHYDYHNFISDISKPSEISAVATLEIAPNTKLIVSKNSDDIYTEKVRVITLEHLNGETVDENQVCYSWRDENVLYQPSKEVSPVNGKFEQGRVDIHGFRSKQNAKEFEFEFESH